jgi:hypothetical protein
MPAMKLASSEARKTAAFAIFPAVQQLSGSSFSRHAF